MDRSDSDRTDPYIDRMPEDRASGRLRIEDLVAFTDNPEPRCACVLLLDTSWSMDGPWIRALNAGVSAFKDALEDDPVASLRVETAIVSFNSGVRLVHDFATVDALDPPELKAEGSTSTAAAINFAIDMLERRKQTYRQGGIPYHRPWIVMITDGAASDGEEQMLAVAERVRQADESKQLAFFCVGVTGADLNELRRMAPRRTALLAGVKYKEFFVWLSNSMARVSSSRADDEINLPDISGWASL